MKAKVTSIRQIARANNIVEAKVLVQVKLPDGAVGGWTEVKVSLTGLTEEQARSVSVGDELELEWRTQ